MLGLKVEWPEQRWSRLRYKGAKRGRAERDAVRVLIKYLMLFSWMHDGVLCVFCQHSIFPNESAPEMDFMDFMDLWRGWTGWTGWTGGAG